MTALELVRAVGRRAVVTTAEHLAITVRILDGKVSYGTPRFLVTPLAGAGTAWINADRLTLEEEG
jgi:hypothetical protein